MPMQADPRNLSAVREPRDWAPDSWQRKPAVQQPSYPDANALAAALAQLHALPPLVTSWEVLALKRKLADAAEGRCFLLKGGDCA
jgi:3-deoxy-7-phosphoheptulonate synthase